MDSTGVGLAWGWKDTDENWGTKKQHKAINNRSKLRAVGDSGCPPHFLGPGTSRVSSSGQTLLQREQSGHTHWAELSSSQSAQRWRVPGLTDGHKASGHT